MLRETPGRLSSIDLVPEEGRDDVIWALGQLNERSRSQADILSELNGRLADKGLDPISKSAFNRRAVRIYMHTKRTEDMCAVFERIAPKLTPESMDKGNLVIGEAIKMLVLEMTEAGVDGIDAKGIAALAQAYVASIRGQKMSGDLRKQMLAEFDAKASAAIDAVAKQRGLSAEVAKDIRAQILGVKE